MDATSHQGWKNYQTWSVRAWIDNDRDLSSRSREIARSTEGDRLDRISSIADQLKDLVNLPSLEGLAGSLLASAKEMIDWLEIAQRILEEEEYESEDEDFGDA